MCQVRKPLNGFYCQNGVHKGPCKSCRIKVSSEWQKSHPKLVRRYAIITRKRIRDTIDNVKKGKTCCDCGKNYPPPCMEFDHIVKKQHTIAIMVRDGWSVEKILEEIQNTEMVCILCHRDRTQRRLPPKPPEKRNAIIKRQFIYWIKTAPCEECGKNYHPWQMDFDHRGEKIHNIAQMLHHSPENIMKELSKCRLLCALCHRLKTCGLNVPYGS